jgi:hypothetical protein
MSEPKYKRPITERVVPVTSKPSQPRKRARLGAESLSSSTKPYRGNKVSSVGKPRKIAPSRVQKTYRNRQKGERSSPRRRVNRDVDYDEIPLSTATQNVLTAKELISPPTKTSNVASEPKTSRMKDTNGRTNPPGSPTVGPRPAVEIPDDKKREEEGPRPVGVYPVQATPAETFGIEDDPIRSFSSSPSELMPLVADKVRIFFLRSGSHIRL